MTNPYYNHGSFPAQNSAGSSASMRAELDAITAGFNKLPTLTANNLVFVNASGTSLEPRSSINGIAIGNSTPSTGAFTTLSSTGTATLAALTVAGATSLAALSLTSLSVTPGDTTLVNLTTTGNTVLGNAVGDTLNVANGSLRVNSSGAIGLGIDPTAKFHVLSTGVISILQTTTARGSGNAILSFYDPTGQKGYFGYGSGASDEFDIINVLNAPLKFGTNNTVWAELSTTGQFGLGVTPLNLLHLKAAAGSVIVRWEDATNGTLGFIGSASGLITAAAATDVALRAEAAMLFASGGNNERMRILSSGPVVVNATTNAGVGSGSDNFAVNGSFGLKGQFNVNPPAAMEMVQRSAAGWDFYTNAGGVLAVQIQTAGHFVPGADNARTLGSSALNWSTVFGKQFSDGATATGALLSTSGGAVFVGGGTTWTAINLNPGGVAGFQVNSVGAWGYPAGTGGTVTQATSKSTGVTLNKQNGEVVMHNQTLNNATSVAFTLTNSFIGANDNVPWTIKSGATSGAYFVQTEQVSAGSCRVHVTNRSANPLGEAIVIQFTVIKGSVS